MRLPALNDLTPEQEEAFLLPLEGNYIVSGPPGSGKTVVVLYRASMIEDKSTVLAYSRVLVQYMSAAMDQDELDANVQTYDSWLRAVYRRLTGRSIPTTRAGGQYSYDWPRVWEGLIANQPSPGDVEYLLVDEGQDMPKQFYSILRLCATNITVSADENQQLFDANSTIKDIADSLGIDRGDAKYHKRLKLNFRNSLPIAQLAAALHVGLDTGVADLPIDRPGPKPRLGRRSRLEVVSAVERFSQANQGKTVGVLVPTKKQVKEYVDLLKGSKSLEYTVQHYYSGSGVDPSELSLDGDTVTVLCYPSAKGLEFDCVFLPELNSYWVQEPTDAKARMLFYVLVSRARERLELSWLPADEPKITKMFPAGLVDRKD